MRPHLLLSASAAVLLLCGAGGDALSHYGGGELAAFADVFRAALRAPLGDDVGTVHHAIEGLAAVDPKLEGVDKAALCKHLLAKCRSDEQELSRIYHLASAAKLLAGAEADCKAAADVRHMAVALQSFAGDDGHSAQELYYLAAAHKHLGGKLDAAKLEKGLIEAIKKDDTAASLGYALHAATYLEPKKAEQFMTHIDDLVQQADEVGGVYLQFDGGLSVTAIAIHGMYALATHVGRPPNIPADRAVKFTSYLLSRRTVRLVRPARHLLSAVTILTDNKYHIPVSLTLDSPLAIGPPPGAGAVRVKACDLLGGSVGPLSLTLDSAVSAQSGATVINKMPMPPVKGDASSTLYQMDMFSSPIASGFYKLTIQAGSQTDKRLIGAGAVPITVKVMREIEVEQVEVSTPDRDHAQSKGNTFKMNPGTKFGQPIDADYHQKVVMKFTVKEKAGRPVNVHQAFVRFSHLTTDQEIIFVAEPENDQEGQYKFDVDLRAKGKEFGHTSGQYKMWLMLGDATVANPVEWYMADLRLRFADEADSGQPPQADTDASHRGARPEIEHTFRQPDKRPATVLSDAFTVACLLPLALLPLLWLRIGINLGNMPASPFTLGFHVGMAGVLCLYVTFWLQLDMFATLKYLALVGGATFVCGNRMLRIMAERRKAKTE